MHKLQNKKLLTLHETAAAQSRPFRSLTASEIKTLSKQNNYATDWHQVFIENAVSIALVFNCRFSGSVYIGRLEPGFTDQKGIRRAHGLYDSYFENCLIGANCAIYNVGQSSGYVIGPKCLIINTSEISCADEAVFGMGSKLNIINENGGRAITIFEGITPGDAYLFGRYRQMNELFDSYSAKANREIEAEPGKIGEASVIKNCRLIHDCRIGPNSFLHECETLDNLTILSSKEEPTEIGEGVGLKNGLVGFSNKIDSGARCDHFASGRNVSIRNVARIGHTFIADNSNISCAELMNNLLFPFHEQHHNNSFLIAAAIGGQSNIAAGATIGSNHNSRAADGEIWADRGFWPGLSTSFKHNSRFAAFALIAKASYEKEMDIPFPFCLVGHSSQTDQVTLMPGYWFKYNMYALARNAWKFKKRDKRVHPQQLIETSFMAPDTIVQIYTAVRLLLDITKGNNLNSVSISGICFKQEALLIKPVQGIELYKQMLTWHTARMLVNSFAGKADEIKNFSHEAKKPDSWENIGGQLVLSESRKVLFKRMKEGSINSWEDIHKWYEAQAQTYEADHLVTALNAWGTINDDLEKTIDPAQIRQLLQEGTAIGAQIVAWAKQSRLKDYQNDFRKVCYENTADMERILGRLEDNPFLIELADDQEQFSIKSKQIMALMNN